MRRAHAASAQDCRFIRRLRRLGLVQRRLQIVVRLQMEPEACGHLESPLETNGGVSGDRPLAQDQLVQPVPADAQLVGDDALLQAERSQELLEQHLARMNHRAEHRGIAREARRLSGSPRSRRRRHRAPPIET